MSVFVPPDQPQKSYSLFGSGGGEQLALENDVPLLAKVPLEMPLQEGANEGRPIIQSRPESLSAKVFRELGIKVFDNIFTTI